MSDREVLERLMRSGLPYVLDKRQLDAIRNVLDENERLKTAGIIEVSVENLNVQHYMEHWEGRAERAEARINAALALHREPPAGPDVCDVCSCYGQHMVPSPCPTVKALRGEE